MLLIDTVSSPQQVPEPLVKPTTQAAAFSAPPPAGGGDKVPKVDMSSSGNSKAGNGNNVVIKHPEDEEMLLSFGMRVQSDASAENKGFHHRVTSVSEGSPAWQIGLR